jgi:hypothetical protein
MTKPITHTTIIPVVLSYWTACLTVPLPRTSACSSHLCVAQIMAKNKDNPIQMKNRIVADTICTCCSSTGNRGERMVANEEGIERVRGILQTRAP